MSFTSLPLFETEGVQAIRGAEYHALLRQGIQQSRHSVLATQFVTDMRPTADDLGSVRFLAHTLAHAAWRGLNVRVVLGAFLLDSIMYDANWPLHAFLENRGVAVRSFVGGGDRGSLHTKLVVLDSSTTIIGSHNWTPASFSTNVELSLCITSSHVAAWATTLFERYWKTSDVHASEKQAD